MNKYLKIKGIGKDDLNGIEKISWMPRYEF